MNPIKLMFKSAMNTKEVFISNKHYIDENTLEVAKCELKNMKTIEEVELYIKKIEFKNNKQSRSLVSYSLLMIENMIRKEANGITKESTLKEITELKAKAIKHKEMSTVNRCNNWIDSMIKRSIKEGDDYKLTCDYEYCPNSLRLSFLNRWTSVAKLGSLSHGFIYKEYLLYFPKNKWKIRQAKQKIVWLFIYSDNTSSNSFTDICNIIRYLKKIEPENCCVFDAIYKNNTIRRIITKKREEKLQMELEDALIIEWAMSKIKI